MKKFLVTALCAGLAAGAVCMPVWADTGSGSSVVVAGESGGPGVSGSGSGGSGTSVPGYETPWYGTADDGVSRPPVTELTDYELPCRLLRITSSQFQDIKSQPDEASDSLSTAIPGDLYYLLDDTMDGWYKIRFNGMEAFISKGSDYDQTGVVESAIKMQPELSASRTQVVQYAFQLLGGKYQFGGRTVEGGLDCSGFTTTVFKNAVGVSLAGSSKLQVQQGTQIDISEVRPGDLIFYGADEASVNHVAIYIGNGKIINAQSTIRGITVLGYRDRSDIFRVVRILPD